MKTYYDKEEDILSIRLGKREYWKSIETSNGIVFDISKEDEIIGVEIFKASRVFKDGKKVIETTKQIA